MLIDYLTRPVQESEKAKSETWQKELTFFYGTLKELQTLPHILDKPVSQSALDKAYVEGYPIELQGQYKAFVSGPQGNIIEEMAYEVQAKKMKRNWSFTKVVPKMSRHVLSTFSRRDKGLSPERFAEILSDMLEMHNL